MRPSRVEGVHVTRRSHVAGKRQVALKERSNVAGALDRSTAITRSIRSPPAIRSTARVRDTPVRLRDSGVELGSSCSECRVAPACANQVFVATGLDHTAVVEHDDLVGVAHGREPVRDRDRRAPFRRAGRAPPARAARSRCRASSSPRRARGSAGCAGSCARSRSAASRRRRTDSRARRRPCRSPRAAPRSRGGCALPRRPSRSPRRSRPAWQSAGSRAPISWKRYVSCETTPTRSDSAWKLRSRMSTPPIVMRAAADVVEPRRQVAERRLARAGLTDERGRRAGWRP